MVQVSDRVRRALESDESGDLDRIVQEKNPEDFAQLRSLLPSGAAIEPGYRRKAIYALGRWGDTTVVPEITGLIPAMGEQDLIAAADALGRLGSEEALNGVLRISESDSRNVRKFAVRALGKFDRPQAVERLVQFRENDPDESLRNLARRFVAEKEGVQGEGRPEH